MRLGLIGGTALGRLPLEEARPLRVATRWGEPAAAPVAGRLRGVEVVFLNRHGDGHRLPPHRVPYRANVAALRELAVSEVVAVNAVGAVDPSLPVGAWVVPEQIIDYTWGRDHSFFDGPPEPVVHVDFTDPYDGAVRRRLIEAAEAVGLPVVEGGVYGVTQGPRLESAAEIRRLARDGCTLVGMTGMPEAALAREAGLPYACLALVVNPAAGLAGKPIREEEIGAVVTEATPRLIELLGAYCRAVSP
ncbi:MAG: S-methyl-5'-thioinosine phosphorylase [Porticoccaceae bacterium]|nr:MAG: S-methyl-5'-thioinosine phosphorylase [Porticoccaceae bacterium]